MYLYLYLVLVTHDKTKHTTEFVSRVGGRDGLGGSDGQPIVCRKYTCWCKHQHQHQPYARLTHKLLESEYLCRHDTYHVMEIR